MDTPAHRFQKSGDYHNLSRFFLCSVILNSEEQHHSTMSENIKIAVVGSGYVGLVAAVCFAEMGHDVICVDNDERKVLALQGGDTLIHEAYLSELLDRYRNDKIRFTTDLGEAT